MKTNIKITTGCIVLLMTLGGCATSKPALQGQLNPNFGQAVDANKTAHAVAPTSAQKANTFIPADPMRAQQARQNYRNNTVAEPARDEQ